MRYLPGLTAALAVLWFALSGETAPLFLGLGILSIVLVILVVARLRILDRDASPYHRILQQLLYFAWLLVEIIKANVAVILKILGPRSAIDPAIVRVHSTTKTDLARALFANSITLTPGTVTADVDGDQLVVHALVRERAPASSFVQMDRNAAKAADPGKA
jgi:multicomponent Na+:H+ antiporter subunit E